MWKSTLLLFLLISYGLICGSYFVIVRINHLETLCSCVYINGTQPQCNEAPKLLNCWIINGEAVVKYSYLEFTYIFLVTVSTILGCIYLYLFSVYLYVKSNKTENQTTKIVGCFMILVNFPLILVNNMAVIKSNENIIMEPIPQGFYILLPIVLSLISTILIIKYFVKWVNNHNFTFSGEVSE